MPHKIFLSHNHSDKPVVEPVAIRLREIFGEDEVFYDDWSIRPGDGIIDKMSAGLEAPEFVFFFVSANSLASGMVKLEWQNALYAASKGRTRIIPVRVDGTDMPPVLMQTLYVDMHTYGIEAAISQIVSITQGDASFTPQHLGFSNLTVEVSVKVDGAVNLTVRASHLMEPNVKFLILLDNSEGEVKCSIPGSSLVNTGFHNGAISIDGVKTNVLFINPTGIALTPKHPVRFCLTRISDKPIRFRGLMHERGENDWVVVPPAQPRT